MYIPVTLIVCVCIYLFFKDFEQKGRDLDARREKQEREDREFLRRLDDALEKDPYWHV